MKLLTPSQRNSLIIALALICGVLFTQTIIDAGRQTIDKERNSIVKENIGLKSTVKHLDRNKNDAITIEGKTQAFEELNSLKNLDHQLANKKVQDWNSLQINIAVLILATMFIVPIIALRYCRKK